MKKIETMLTVSVIIPTYNRADLLQEALESVFAQTYTDYEVIVIDDGSTDNTEEVVLQLFARHCEHRPEATDKVRYIKQSNAGVSVARNHGIFEARGEWIAFLDSDDLWVPEKLEKQMTFLADHPTAGAVAGPFGIYQEGQVIKDEQGHVKYYFCEHPTSVLPYEIFAKKYPVPTPSVLVRKTVLYLAGLFEGGITGSEDFYMWVKIARFTEFWFLNDVLGYCRRHTANTHDFRKPEIRFYGAMVRQLQVVRWGDDPRVVRIYEKGLSEFYEGCATLDRKEQRYKEAAPFYWNAAWYAHGLKSKGRLFVKSFIAKIFPFVFRIWDKRRGAC